MNKQIAIALSIIPVLLVAIGVFTHISFRPIKPSAIERYDKIINKFKSTESCNTDPCIEIMLKRSAMVDIHQEEAHIHMSAALKDLSAIMITCGLVQLLIIFFILKRNSKNRENNL